MHNRAAVVAGLVAVALVGGTAWYLVGDTTLDWPLALVVGLAFGGVPVLAASLAVRNIRRERAGGGA